MCYAGVSGLTGSKRHSLNLEYGWNSGFQCCTFLSLCFQCSSLLFPPPSFLSHALFFHTLSWSLHWSFLTYPQLSSDQFVFITVLKHLWLVSFISNHQSFFVLSTEFPRFLASFHTLLFSPDHSSVAFLLLSTHSIILFTLLSKLLPSLSSSLFHKLSSWFRTDRPALEIP